MLQDRHGVLKAAFRCVAENLNTQDHLYSSVLPDTA